jgi:acetyl esterase/lipase
MVKRAMDVFYASVGTAMDLTGDGNTAKGYDALGSKHHHESAAKWQLTLVTAAVASFYSVIGARDKAAAVTSSSESASYLIRNAWGMVSLPAVKNLSLQASRLIKGAAVADRIEICGIHCFILSSDPAPELAAAIKRSHRSNQRQRGRKPFVTLSTIDEQEEHIPCKNNHRRDGCTASFARSSSRRYRQRNVIFHLTGGGFFAHIHSTDLPYLLDWSAATGAVVICPEYALLPEHTFPVALHEVEAVYEALVSDEAVSVLGFETNRIIVTGESAGGNLAASLCVKISTDDNNKDLPIDFNYHIISNHPSETGITETRTEHVGDAKLDTSSDWKPVRLPDALMLSCPVLDLSLELSHSRVIGNDDPVLPSGLISAISDAYLPAKLGISKKDPLASPFYAGNDILRRFPSTLLFASSNDPLLDDSVVLNQRLHDLGVESDLIAAHNLPHAYLGLGTAGFPEAQQIQEHCIVWLNRQFTKSNP